jgi:hypothetical protein
MSRALAHLTVHLMTQQPSGPPGRRRRRKISAPGLSRQSSERLNAPPAVRPRER